MKSFKKAKKLSPPIIKRTYIYIHTYGYCLVCFRQYTDLPSKDSVLNGHIKVGLHMEDLGAIFVCYR